MDRDEDVAGVLRLCKFCGYDLRGLGTSRCPECGHTFDPEDASTLSVALRRRCLGVLFLMYLLPATFNCLFWAGFLSTCGVRYGISSSLVRVLLLANCGPCLFLFGMLSGSLSAILLITGMFWAVWCALLWRTGLRNMPLLVHLFLASAWCLTSSCVLGISV